MRYGMVIDLDRCIGCQACVIACKEENLTSPGIFWNKVYDIEGGKYPNVKRVFFPRPCMHCKDAPCVTSCPTKATYRHEWGMVLIDYDKCIGCRLCQIVCAYNARSFPEREDKYFKDGYILDEFQEPYQKHQVKVAEKCTYCIHRVEEGKEPACVGACPTDALCFGDLDDPESQVSILIRSKRAFQLLPELGFDSSTWYLNRR